MTEQHDLVARLRGMFVRFATETEDEAAIRRKATALEAAARIEALESDNARMREALGRIEAACPFTPPHPAESEYDFGYQYFNTADDYALHRANRDASSVGDIARAALAGDAP